MNKNMQLAIAIVAGAAAVFGNNFYVKQEIDQIRPKKEVTVLRAKKSIQAGQTVGTDLIEAVRVPENFSPKSAIRDSDRAVALGQISNVDVHQGDYILTSYFGLKTSVGRRLSDQVDSANFRAITIPVDETNSLARSIEAGDRIDIVFSFAAPGTAARFSTLLLQSVPVISTGTYSPSEQELRSGIDPNKRYASLTLRLPPIDAMRLTYARQAGSISILLRKQDDNTPVEIQPITSIKDLLSATEREAVEKSMQQAAQAVLSGDHVKEQVRELLEKQRQQGR